MKNIIKRINGDLRHFIKYGILVSALLISILVIKRILMPHRLPLFVFVMNILCPLLVSILPMIGFRKRIRSITYLNLFVLDFLAISMVIFAILLYALFTRAFGNYELSMHIMGVLFLLCIGAVLSLVVTYLARFLTRDSS